MRQVAVVPVGDQELARKDGMGVFRGNFRMFFRGFYGMRPSTSDTRPARDKKPRQPGHRDKVVLLIRGRAGLIGVSFATHSGASGGGARNEFTGGTERRTNERMMVWE